MVFCCNMVFWCNMVFCCNMVFELVPKKSCNMNQVKKERSGPSAVPKALSGAEGTQARHCNGVSLHRRFTPSALHSIGVSLNHGFISSAIHIITLSYHPPFIPSPFHAFTLSCHHPFTPSALHSIIFHCNSVAPKQQQQQQNYVYVHVWFVWTQVLLHSKLSRGREGRREVRGRV